MAIAKLNLVSLDFDKDNCNDVLLELYQRDDFHPELASKFTDSVAGLSAYNNDNLYEELLSRIEEMKTKYHFEVPEVETDSQFNVFRAKEFLDDLTTRDQQMMFAVLTFVLTADSLEQLEADSETLLTTARKHLCQMAPLNFQQMDGLNTALPIGLRKINALRTLTTESLAVLNPFRVQEIMDKDGIYYGENAISHNLIMVNKENLLNQSAFLLGVPGSGKSFSAKELIVFLALSTNDDILVCDPENEYSALIKTLGGEVIHIAAGSDDHINAMDMTQGYGEGKNPVIDKSEFILSLFEQLNKNGLGAKEKSIIDFFTGAGTGIIVSCLLSPDSIRRTVVIIIGLVMIGIGWYKKTRYDNKVFRYMEEFKEDS